jgi:hypothetical protein
VLLSRATGRVRGEAATSHDSAVYDVTQGVHHRGGGQRCQISGFARTLEVLGKTEESASESFGAQSELKTVDDDEMA